MSTEQAPTREWRIDDLAHDAGVTVDTIRYYAREGLLPRPQRVGRHTTYTARHLDRLHRIRELRKRKFSLAAIKAILDSDIPGVEGVFAADERSYSLAELSACSGLDPELVDELGSTGILPDPSEFGREAYDASDLGLLEAIADLVDAGMPQVLIVELSRIYARHFERLQRDVVTLLTSSDALGPEPEHLDDLRRRLTAESGRLIPAAERVLHYGHQRTLQRVALQSLQDTARTTDSEAARHAGA